MTDNRKGIAEAISKKKTADMRWNQVFSILSKGGKADPEIIARCMMECNNADILCMNMGLKIKDLTE